MADPNPKEIEIIEAVEVISADPSRMGKKDTWVTYKYADGRTYMLIMPAELATESEIEKRIRTQEAARQKLIGKKFSV